MNHFRYVIVGGGLAGASAVEGIREHDRTGTIALFGKENRLPYDRPPLSKGLWFGKVKLEEIPIHDDAFYSSQDVRLHLNTEVEKIHPLKHEVLDKNGTSYTYEKLLIATGGLPRRLPFGERALHYFRTVEDYLWLKEQSEKAGDFILIGGGFIASELAAALTLNNRKVTMVFPDQTLMQKVLPADLASFVTDYYRSKDVTLLNGVKPAGAEWSKNKAMILTSSGQTISADAAIAAIGLDLSVGIAESAGLKTENGIAVNQFLQTSNADVYAAGDIAYFPAAALGKRIRIEHWNNAQSQGKYAGENMAGAKKSFDYLPYFYSDLFDLGFEAVGELDSRMTTFSDWKEEFREGVVYYLDNARVKGVLLWNVWEKVDAAREIINKKKEYKNTSELKGSLLT